MTDTARYFRMKDLLKALAGVLIFGVCVVAGGLGGCYAGQLAGSAALGDRPEATGGVLCSAMLGAVLGCAAGIGLTELLIRRLRD